MARDEVCFTTFYYTIVHMVPLAGLEPTRPVTGQGILSPPCLPFHHSGANIKSIPLCSVRQRSLARLNPNRIGLRSRSLTERES